MTTLVDTLVGLAEETGFAGVVRVDQSDVTTMSSAFGLADRRHEVANTVDTRFGLASGTKGLTALTVMSLVADGTLSLDTTVRPLLGDDLPLIDDSVTIEHLLAHRSGIGDYIDESAGHDINAYVMPVPVHRLDSTEAYLAAIDGYPQVERPGTTFRYNNGGFVVVALLAERATGTPFQELVAERVTGPVDMVDTSFVRADSLPGRTAVGYLAADGLQTNVFHLPVVGSGDGGVYSTVADIHRLWAAIQRERVLPTELRNMMFEPRSDALNEGMRYGLGFWLHPTGASVSLEGMDAGVSFRTVHDPETSTTHTVIANTSSGAWPITRAIDEWFGLS